jgi:hypothetical protein
MGRYQFSHSLVQALLYEELPPARRAQLHRRIGEALEVLSQTQAPSYLSQMAYHFFEASQEGQVDKAVDYAIRAADHATGMFAYEDAQRYYDMALKALGLHEPMDHTRRGETLMSLAQVHWYLGRFLDALDTFRQAADVARHANTPEAMARAALGFARAQIYPGISWASAVSLLEEALCGLSDSAWSHLLKAMQQCHNLAMLNHYPLRGPGRAGGIHDIRKIPGPHVTTVVILTLLGNPFPICI